MPDSKVPIAGDPLPQRRPRRFYARIVVSGPLERRAVVAALAATGLVLSVAIAGGIVRIFPFLVAPEVPLAVAAPFARGLLAVGFETALLFGPPVGWASGCASALARGEVQALLAIGASPARLAARTLPAALGFGCLAALAAALWGAEASTPGRMARALVAASRASCVDRGAGRPAVVDVPLVGASWICSPSEPPRLVSGLPSGGAGLVVADKIDWSDDLRSIDLDEVRLGLGPRAGVRIRVHRLGIRGLAPWARASNLAPSARAALIASTGVGLSLLGVWLLLQRAARPLDLGKRGPGAIPAARRRVSDTYVQALGTGACGPTASLLVLSALERTQARPWSYLLVPAVGFLAAWVAASAIPVLGRFVGSMRDATTAVRTRVARAVGGCYAFFEARRKSRGERTR